jgi:hypothetical protein
MRQPRASLASAKVQSATRPRNPMWYELALIKELKAKNLDGH